MGFTHFFASDFENTTFQNLKDNKTYVYGAGIKEAFTNDNVEIFDNIEGWFEWVVKNVPAKSCIYFHNLGNYDGHIILDYLLSNGYEYVASDKKMPQYSFTAIIDSMNSIYQIKLKIKKHIITFRDSAKLMVGTLEGIGNALQCKTAKLVGSYDYDSIKYGHIMNAIERQYLNNDVELLSEILEKFDEMGLLKHMTSAGYAINALKDKVYDKEELKGSQFYLRDRDAYWKSIFPELSHKEESFIRQAYRGGYVDNLSDGEIKRGIGWHYDVNSEYPFAMHSFFENGVDTHAYPYGRGEYFVGDDENPSDESVLFDEVYEYYFVRVNIRFKVKEHHIAFLQLKNFRFAATEHIKESYDEVEVVFSKHCWELFKEQYDIISLEIIDGYRYMTVSGIFDKFIDENYSLKSNAPNKIVRSAVKIKLNSCYGKLGENPIRISSAPYLEDGEVKYKAFTSVNKNSSSYIPAGAVCTDIARCYIIRAAQKQIDYYQDDEAVYYIDTDSLFTKYQAVELWEDPKALGAFALESKFDEGRFVRAKTYAVHNIELDGTTPDFSLEDLTLDDLRNLEVAHDDVSKKALSEYRSIRDIKCCGLNEHGKDSIRADENWIDIFTIGLTISDGKLMKKRCEGGVALKHGDFAIR